MGLLPEYFFTRQKNIISPLPVLWDVELVLNVYIEIQLRSIYGRILAEVLTRSHEIKDEFRPLLRDSMEGEGQKGLVEYLVSAMADQKDLILKYDAGIVVAPEYAEKASIIEAWKRGQKPPRTMMLSFKRYQKTTMLRQYLHHKYLLLVTQHKMLNLSAALQLKINDLRQSVALSDAASAQVQAQTITEALLAGSPALLDAKDMIELTTPDIGPIKEVAADLHNEISLILGLPVSWVAGVMNKGLGDSGDADARAIERGLEPYFWESIYPAFQLLFGETLKFKSDNTMALGVALETLRAFETVSDDLLVREQKIRILNRLFNLSDEENDPEREPEPVPEPLQLGPAIDNRIPPRDGGEASPEETD